MFEGVEIRYDEVVLPIIISHNLAKIIIGKTLTPNQ